MFLQIKSKWYIKSPLIVNGRFNYRPFTLQNKQKYIGGSMSFTPNRLDEIGRGDYKGRGAFGLSAILKGRTPEGSENFFDLDELQKLQDIAIESRMPIKNNAYYLKQSVMKSVPIKNLISPQEDEMLDLEGEIDPGNQKKYMPVAGLLHKYPEIVLLYASPTCSGHCRYCYRLDLFTGKSGKEYAKIEPIIEYIKNTNKEVDEYNDSVGYDPEKRKFRITEALLSGGDPMVLANKQLYTFMCGLAEAGVQTIRIGTKELAFFPYRFDEDFFKMLDIFHEEYEDVKVDFMVHFTHPDEFLDIKGTENTDGTFTTEVAHDVLNLRSRYNKRPNGTLQWRPETEKAVTTLLSRNWINLYNQCPIIRGVNDHSPALNVMQRALHHKGVHNHYFFQCREIEGHKAFAVPVEKAYDIFNEAQKGLSGTERTRFAMSTEWGKMEIVGRFNFASVEKVFTDEGISPQVNFAIHALRRLFGDKFVIFRIVRSPYNVKTYGRLIVAKSNPEALWLSAYEDDIIYDGRKPAEEQSSMIGKVIAGLIEEIDLTSFIRKMANPEGETKETGE